MQADENAPPDITGDTLTYAIGPQWTAQLSSRWVTHTRLLVGGNKVNQEHYLPEIRKELEEKNKNIHVFPPIGDQYTRDVDSNAFAIVTGAGFDYKLNNAVLFRSALDYSHTWNHDINNINYRNSFRFTSGLVLNMGTW